MSDTITIVVDFNNPKWVTNKSFTVPCVANGTIHDALIAAYDANHALDPEYTFDLRYSGKQLGSFVQSLYGVPTTMSTSWEIFVNDEPATKGIDTLVETAGQTVTFRYVLDKDELGVTAASKRALRR
jgi:hypothetical protein